MHRIVPGLLTSCHGFAVFTCWADAAAEAIEPLVGMRSHKSPLANLSARADRFGIKLKSLDLSQDGAKLDVVGAVSGDLGVESPVVELEDGLLHGGKEGGVAE
jgi:hypothetical protein